MFKVQFIFIFIFKTTDFAFLCRVRVRVCSEQQYHVLAWCWPVLLQRERHGRSMCAVRFLAPGSDHSCLNLACLSEAGWAALVGKHQVKVMRAEI